MARALGTTNVTISCSRYAKEQLKEIARHDERALSNFINKNLPSFLDYVEERLDQTDKEKSNDATISPPVD